MVNDSDIDVIRHRPELDKKIKDAIATIAENGHVFKPWEFRNGLENEVRYVAADPTLKTTDLDRAIGKAPSVRLEPSGFRRIAGGIVGDVQEAYASNRPEVQETLKKAVSVLVESQGLKPRDVEELFNDISLKYQKKKTSSVKEFLESHGMTHDDSTQKSMRASRILEDALQASIDSNIAAHLIPAQATPAAPSGNAKKGRSLG